MTALPFATEFRMAAEGDVGFIVSAWLRSYHDGSSAMRGVQFNRYKAAQRDVVRVAMERGCVVVACDAADRNSIFGFACGEDDNGAGVVHYAYVLQTRRRYGLARELVRHLGHAAKRTMTSYSHSTITGARVAQRLGLSHNPFALVRLLHADRQALRTGRHQDWAPGKPEDGSAADPAVPRRVG